MRLYEKFDIGEQSLGEEGRWLEEGGTRRFWFRPRALQTMRSVFSPGSNTTIRTYLSTYDM